MTNEMSLAERKERLIRLIDMSMLGGFVVRDGMKADINLVFDRVAELEKDRDRYLHIIKEAFPEDGELYEHLRNKYGEQQAISLVTKS
jgi:hypothetical protein